VYGKGIQFLRDGKIAFHGFEVLAAGEGNDFGIDQVLRKIIPDLCAEYPFDIGIHHDEPAGIFDFTLRQQGRVLRVEKVEGVDNLILNCVLIRDVPQVGPVCHTTCLQRDLASNTRLAILWANSRLWFL
jgi:hypothetical protein